MRVDKMIAFVALSLAIVAAALTNKKGKTSDMCMVASYCLLGLLFWLMWG